MQATPEASELIQLTWEPMMVVVEEVEELGRGEATLPPEQQLPLKETNQRRQMHRGAG